ncbi:unnamed protein product [Calypogeia fissa]
MEWIMKAFRSLQNKIESCGEASSSCGTAPLQIPGRVLNDSIYEFHKPEGRPSVEVVCFHGLNLDGATDAHLTTWLSAGGTQLWLEWILEEIPEALILLISYDAFAKRTRFAKGSSFEELTTLNKEAQRRNENFRQLREKYIWRTYGIQEGLPTTLEGIEGFIVREASARHDVDNFYTDRAADHFSSCRPGSTTSSSFRLLLKFIAGVLENVFAVHLPPCGSLGVVLNTLTTSREGSIGADTIRMKAYK